MKADIEVSVLAAVKKSKLTSAQIAEKMGLQVFQVTARLASMEKKGLLSRDGKLWFSCYSGEMPAVSKKKGAPVVEVAPVPTFDHLIPISAKGKNWKVRYRDKDSGHDAATFITPDGERFSAVPSPNLATHIANLEGLDPVFLRKEAQ